MLLVVIIAWILTRVIFHVIGHTYRPFTDPFDASKLGIDIGVWVCAFAAVSWLAGKISAAKP